MIKGFVVSTGASWNWFGWERTCLVPDSVYGMKGRVHVGIGLWEREPV